MAAPGLGYMIGKNYQSGKGILTLTEDASTIHGITTDNGDAVF